jgi:RNA polymerase sigma factor (sigma-70 family)
VGSRPGEADLAELYLANFAGLVRLAAFLCGDPSAAEGLVQDAYLRVASSLTRLREPDQLLAYLRQAVVNLSRSSLSRRLVGHRLTRPADMVPVPDENEALFQRQLIVQALAQLPRRRREIVVLRFYLDLPFAEIGQLLGISESSARSGCSRALSQLGPLIEEMT